MAKKNQQKSSKPVASPKRKFNIFVVAFFAVLIVISVGVWQLSKWKNTLAIPDLPNFSGQPTVFVEYMKRMHNSALDNPSSDQFVGHLGMAFHANFYYEEAERCYNQAIKLNSSQWRWPYYLALIREELGDAHFTIRNLQHVLEINPNISQAWFRIGNAYLKLNNYDKAVTAFKKVVKLKPFTLSSSTNIKLVNKGAFAQKAYAQLNLARASYQKGYLTEAREALRALVKQYSGFGPAYRLLSQVYYSQGKRELGEEFALRAGDFVSYVPPADIIYDDLILYSRRTDFIIKQIDIAVQSRNFDWAVALNRHIFEYNPQDKEALSKLLKLAIDLNQKAGLESLVKVYKEHHQDDEHRVLEMVRFMLFRKQYKIALELLQQVTTTNPGLIEAHVEYVTILGNLNQFTKAIEHCKKVIPMAPENAQIKIELARMYFHQGKVVQAREQLKLAEQINPQNEAGFLLQAQLWRYQKNRPKAVEFYRESLKINPVNVFTSLELGNYFIELRDWKNALQHFQQALKISPNNVDYIERSARILSACPQTRFRDIKKALGFAERLKVVRKYTREQDIRSAMTIAITYAEQKRFNEALAIVDDYLVKLNTGNFEGYLAEFRSLRKIFRAEKQFRL